MGCKGFEELIRLLKINHVQPGKAKCRRVCNTTSLEILLKMHYLYRWNYKKWDDGYINHVWYS